MLSAKDVVDPIWVMSETVDPSRPVVSLVPLGPEYRCEAMKNGGTPVMVVDMLVTALRRVY